MTAPASPLLQLPGAVAAEDSDSGVAAHYGNPFGEQRTLLTGAGVVDRSTRGVLRVGGEDRLSWLHSLTSQHLEALPPWRGAEALVLDPHGRVEHDLQLADDGSTTWCDVEPGTLPALLSFLERMRFLLRVEPADASAQWAVLSVLGPRAAAAVAAGVGARPGAEVYDVVALPAGGLLRTAPPLGTPAYDLMVPRQTLTETASALRDRGAQPVGVWAYEALRVAARVPRLGFETDHKTIPHEVGWLAAAVHLDKGCYRGQETVARVQNLGRPPRRLVLMHLDGSDLELPPHGVAVEWEGRQVGFVTTSARHAELGPVALALIKRNTPDEAELLAGGVAASIDFGTVL